MPHFLPVSHSFVFRLWEWKGNWGDLYQGEYGRRGQGLGGWSGRKVEELREKGIPGRENNSLKAQKWETESGTQAMGHNLSVAKTVYTKVW